MAANTFRPMLFLVQVTSQAIFKSNSLSLKKAFKALIIIHILLDFQYERLQFHLNSNSYTTQKYLEATNVFPLHFNSVDFA